jgi:hypothetical protein
MRLVLTCLPLLLLFALDANAYVRTMAETGLPLYWASPQISFLGNPSNRSGMSASEVSTELAAAIGAWSAVSGTSASGTYSQSTGGPANSNFDGVNALYFTSAPGRSMDYGVIALTEVTYYLNSGQIAESDISFNDNLYLFTDQEGDTGKSIGGRTAVYLRDVATHEAGHAFGLDHSIVNLSSLIYTAFSGQYALSADDESAIRTIYPSTGNRGSLVGTVMGRRGGIFGAHVEAINLATGNVESGALANSDGGVRLGDLPPGQYALLMEPFGSNIASVSSYFRNVNHRFCSGSNFRRRFYGPCGSNTASVVEVSAGSSTNVGVLAPACTQMGNPSGTPGSLASAADFPAEGGARFGTLNTGDTHYYRVNGVSGTLNARAHSYTLYSPIDVKVEILDENGNALSGATSIDNVQDPMPGGFVNYDSYAEATVPTGNYVLRVRAAPTRLYSNVFPAGFDLLDASGYYLLSLSVNGSFGPNASSDMSSCVSVNNTVQSASFRAPASTREKDSGGGGCGSIGTPGSPWSGGPGQTLLFAGFLHILFLLRRLKAALVRKRR